MTAQPDNKPESQNSVIEMQYKLLLGVRPRIEQVQSILHFTKHASETLGLKSAHIYKLDLQLKNSKSVRILKHTRIASEDRDEKPKTQLLQVFIQKCLNDRQHLLQSEGQYFGFVSRDCQLLILFENTAQLEQGWINKVFLPAVTQLNEYCYVCSQKQISTESESSHTDRLTQLPDRREFKYSLLKLLSNAIRQEYYSAVVYLNIDNFKFINNSLGHSTGDLIITRVAERLKKFCRAGDYIFRMGGDEFVFVLNHLGDKIDTATISAQNIAIRIMENIVKPFELGEQKVYLTSSIGISMFPSENEQENDSESILKQANMAMYNAKNKGKNCLTFYNQTLQDTANDHFIIYNQLITALDNDEFRLAYQPIVDINGNIIGAETLLRWNNKKLGNVPPDKFIYLTEESNLILDIGNWVIENACQFLKQIKESVPDLKHFEYISVNVSPKQLEQHDFVSRIDRKILEAGIDASEIRLEITENTLVKNMEHTIKIMKVLNQHNITFMLDDFGTGYSSLSYLYKLPISAIKIDKSFVSGDNGQDIANQVIVDTIIAMSEKMNLKCVVEGVETLESACYFIEKEVYGIQGYHYHRPMPGQELIELLKEKSLEAKGQ